MLSEEVIEKVSERLVERINNANIYVIKKIANKIKQIGQMNPSSSNDILAVMEYGGDLEDIAKELSKATRMNIKEIYEIFEEVAKNDLHFAKKYYDYKEVPYIPWEDNIILQREVLAIAKQTAETYLNISNTRGIGYTITDSDGNVVFKDISNLYKDLVDDGIVSISQGKSTFEEEMGKVAKEIGKSGLKYVDYDTGNRRRLDSALRMNINDGIRQLHNKSQEIFGEEFGADGIEISVHSYPAPDHAKAQGRQFKKKEFDKLQEKGIAKDLTGESINLHQPLKRGGRTLTHRPISQYNCYHSTFSIIVGVSKPNFTPEQLNQILEDNEKGFEYEGKKYTLYEGSQLQRKMELEVRRQKDVQILARESGLDKEAEEAQRMINDLTNEYYNLSKVSGLPTKIERLNVVGYKEIDLTK